MYLVGCVVERLKEDFDVEDKRKEKNGFADSVSRFFYVYRMISVLILTVFIVAFIIDHAKTQR
ncbi:hypothetical protein E2C01_057724 [Portunus trituberculatus]|uniref:Uncharacterized protein n=1 Tax=Portunus trituberculatus TaxID=210409 RepID=A0A5B7H464_PORTR|nr:hypothetical protein [Portunus trituberculatus]